MTETKYDIIVIGSGPAGATAAYRLARDGFRTLLLEREKLPRYKACGGGITDKVFKKIDFDISPLVEDAVEHVALSYRHRTLVNMDFAQPPLSLIMRDKFDYYLTERAAQEGAIVHDAEAVRQVSIDEDGVRVRTASAEYAAEIVVGADGTNGITARAADLAQPRSIAAALEVELAVSDAQLDAWRNRVLIDMGAIPFGYAWIFPKSDHLSVGIGTYVRGPLFPRFVQHGGEARADLRARLNEWIALEPTLRDGRVLIEKGHLVPLGGRAALLHSSRVVLAGDAGGLVDPLLAEGIYFAMRSGQIAAEEISDAFRREDFDLSPYTRRIETEFLPQFRDAAGMARVGYRFPHASLKALSIAPTLRNSISRVVDGDGNLSHAARRVARTVGNWLDLI